MVDTFPPIAFQSSLGTSSLLLAIFGFLYGIYANFGPKPGEIAKLPPDIVRNLEILCKVLAPIIAVNSGITIWSLAIMGLTGLANIVFAVGFAGTALILGLVSIWLAYWTMGE